MDAPRIDGLAEAIRTLRDGRQIYHPNAPKIAGRILYCLDWLWEQLEHRLPGKEELKLFLRTMYQDEMPSRDEPYTQAFKLIGYPDSPRKNMDQNKIVSLALRARKIDGEN